MKIDAEMLTGDIHEHKDDFISRLDSIERRVSQISVPLGFSRELYDLRVHIELLREKLMASGFKVHSLANAEDYDFDETVILYNTGQEEAAQQLKIIFENADIYEYNSQWTYYKSKADLMLILGKDYKDYLD